MIIKELKLKNYRNYEEAEVNFDKEINIVYGNNAEGKTNLLESIYMCSTSKSHKNSKDVEIINFNKNESHIKIVFEKEKTKTIDIQLNKDQKKGIAIDRKKIEKLSDFLGTFSVVMFAPEDLNIIKEGPSVRRKFLDMEMCQIDKFYVKELLNYNKIIGQRNAILKDIHFADNSNRKYLIEILETYDEQLIEKGIAIIKKRKENIKELKEKVEKTYKNISDNKETLIIEYENFLEEKEEIKQKEEYKKLLIEKREEDIKNQYTMIGPHRDDICFMVEGKDIRKFGSQGQKKTAAISLKLSELEIIKEKINDTPVLLLDDVFSELDETRQKMLVASIKGIQTIITCTGIKRNIYDLLNPNALYKVSNNKIKKVEKKIEE